MPNPHKQLAQICIVLDNLEKALKRPDTTRFRAINALVTSIWTIAYHVELDATGESILNELVNTGMAKRTPASQLARAMPLSDNDPDPNAPKKTCGGGSEPSDTAKRVAHAIMGDKQLIETGWGRKSAIGLARMIDMVSYPMEGGSQ